MQIMKINHIESLELSGYVYGLKQTSVQMSFQINLPGLFDLDFITQELTKRFLLQPETQKLNKEFRTNTELNAVAYVWEVLGLSNNLLQTIKIPVFERGIILDVKQIDPRSKEYLFLVQIPWVDQYPKVWITSCMNWALKIVTALAENKKYTSEDIGKLLDKLHETFIVDAIKTIPGGGSTVPFLRTAHLLNIPFKHLNSSVYQIGWSSRSHLMDRSTTELDSALGASLSHNKYRSIDLLRKAAFPVPLHYLARTTEHAMLAASKLGYPVVIKPSDKDRGEGVTVDIFDEIGLLDAYQKASVLSRNILVEKQVPGMCYRILVFSDQVLYTVARLPIAVMGDGIHNIETLINQANAEESQKAKHLRQKTFPADELALNTLKKQSYELSSIPDVGSYAYLRPIETTEWGGLPAVFSDSIHPDNKKLAIKAAKLFGLNVAGIDFITQDITIPWHQNGAVINEINFAPYIGTKYEYQKNGVRDMVRALYPKGGRIPVEVFIGDHSAWRAALNRQTNLGKDGIRVFVTSHAQTHSNEDVVHMSVGKNSLVTRCNALLMNREVDAILLVIQTDELLKFGSPIDSIDEITIINEIILNHKDLKLSVDSTVAKKLNDVFLPYLNNIEHKKT